MRRLLITLIALASLGALVPAAARASLAGCGGNGPFEVCFNDPTGNEFEQARIVRRERELIRATGKGDRIRIAMFSWTIGGIANEVIAARRRKVDVRIVIDGSSYGTRAVKRMRRAGVPVTPCASSCTSHVRGSINHLKLFLIRRGASRDVLVTSSNLTGKQRSKLYNDMIRVRDDARLFSYLSAYWRRLRARSWSYGGRYWGNAQRTFTGRSGARAYLFQRTNADPVLRALRGIRSCRGRRGFVFVSMALFSTSRAAVQRELRKLRGRRKRCRVRVLIGPHVSRPFVSAGLARGAVRQAAIHHKFMLFHARTAAGWRRVLYTGSHNYTTRALRANDEILLRIRNRTIFNAYVVHFIALFQRAQR